MCLFCMLFLLWQGLAFWFITCSVFFSIVKKKQKQKQKCVVLSANKISCACHGYPPINQTPNTKHPKHKNTKTTTNINKRKTKEREGGRGQDDNEWATWVGCSFVHTESVGQSPLRTGTETRSGHMDHKHQCSPTIWYLINAYPSRCDYYIKHKIKSAPSK